MKSRRAFLVKPGKFGIKEMDIKPGKGQVLVKVAAEQRHFQNGRNSKSCIYSR